MLGGAVVTERSRNAGAGQIGKKRRFTAGWLVRQPLWENDKKAGDNFNEGAIASKT
jgi:hypothetical protein